MNDPSKRLLTSNLLLRVLSAIVLIPVVLGAVYMGEWAFFALIALVCALGMHEWTQLTAPNMVLKARIVTLMCLLVVISTSVLKGLVPALLLMLLASVLVAWYGWQAAQTARLRGAVWAGVGVPYLALAGMFLLLARQAGIETILYLLVVVWATDTGAYFAGRIIGGPKLLPSISPKKTWAGLIGGMIAAAGLAYGLRDMAWPGFDLWGATVAAAGLAVVSQAGDFFESYVKRRVGAKDSGTIIPGHGGILDRIDGLLFAAPALALALPIIRG